MACAAATAAPADVVLKRVPGQVFFSADSAVPAPQVKGRKGSKRVGGRGSSGKGGRYVGGR